MSGYLIDTCIVRRWYGGSATIVGLINALPSPAPLYTSAITRGEIEFAHLNPAATDKQKQADFRRWIRETFDEFDLPITGFTGDDYAKFRRRLFTRFPAGGKRPEDREDHLGQKLGIDENDLWLTAQACERNLVLVTSDKMARIREIVDSDITVLVWPGNN